MRLSDLSVSPAQETGQTDASDSSLILISWAETVLRDTLTCSPRHYQSSQWADVLRVAWSFPSQNIDTVSVRPRLMREIPWQLFLIDEQVDVYYFFLLSLRRTCHHVYLQTRNSKTSPDIQSQNRECQCQLNCLSDILLWTDILCELPVYYSGDEYYSLLSM